MFSTIEGMVVMLVLAVLKNVIKNPQSVAKEGMIIANLAQVATEADTAVNGTLWTSQSAAPAAEPATHPLTGAASE